MSVRNRALILTGLLLFCAAFPLRLRVGFWIFRSVSILDLFLLLTPLWLLIVNWERPHRVSLGERTVFAVLALPLLLAVMSLAWSENPSQTLYYIVQTLLALAAYLLAVNFVQYLTVPTVMRCLAVLTLTAVATAALAMAKVPGFSPQTYGLEPGSFEHFAYLASFYSRMSHPYWGLSNGFASVLAFFIPLFLGWVIVSKQRWFIVVAAVVLLAICLSLSRGVLLATLVGVLAALLFFQRGRKTVTAFLFWGLAVASAALLSLVMWRPEVGGYIANRLEFATVEARLEKFERAIIAIQQSPFFGFGAGVTPRGEEVLLGSAHNSFIQAIMEFGIPLGLIFFFAFFLLCLLFLLRLGPFSRTEPIMTVAVGGGLVSILFAFMTQGAFEGVLLRILFYLALGFSISTVFSKKPTNELKSFDLVKN